MEVAGQWRREWAGTAEYGKVTEGGVTRQVARAMEVLHASAPGARVRVLRAAYHSTAGPGEPASSYMLHSSRRVISSGYNFVEPESLPSKPLEISSTPLETSPESEFANDNYKVTEPDDIDISEPSKWRGSKNINTLRMPSEESSSADNASIIDLDYNNKNTNRKKTDKFTAHTYHQRLSSPITPLLDTPVTLSTLKYKSLLNGNDSWNNRRKSYSFEETPLVEEPNIRENDVAIMESSTDSGICKSSEIVNSETYNSESNRYSERKTKMEDIHEETFKDWLSKNRQKHYTNHVQSKKEHVIGIELSDQNNIILQSSGKMSIKLPMSTKTDDYYHTKSGHANDEYDKRTKKVEFCKTELHFAAESGTVNIIATDDKPPPSNDFRKKRSLFVPMSNYNKSITLFGEKSDDKNNCTGTINEVITIDENTAATRGILKNKIPKPKPYLLGENMVLGDSNDLLSVANKSDTNNNDTKPTRVSLINKQLQLERKFSNESRASTGSETDWNSLKKPIRTTKTGPIDYTRTNQEIEHKSLRNQKTEKDLTDAIKSKVKILQMSPTPARAKTRQLRESDLTYFGITQPADTKNEKRKYSLDSIYAGNNLSEEVLHSVQLVKLISNSVSNSEIDSDEAPDYANVPLKNNYLPKPAPRLRSKYQTFIDNNKELKDLNPILEKDDETVLVEPRRVRVKRHTTTSSRSLSEPAKPNRQKFELRTDNKTHDIKTSSSPKSNADTLNKLHKNKTSKVKHPERKTPESPLYANLETKDIRRITDNDSNHGRDKVNGIQRHKSENKCITTKDNSSHTKVTKDKLSTHNIDNVTNVPKQSIDLDKQKVQDHSLGRKRTNVQRTKVLVTPEKSPDKYRETSSKKDRSSEKKVTREKKKINHITEKYNSPRIDIHQESIKGSSSDRDSKKGKSTTPSQPDLKAQKKIKNMPSETASTPNSLKEQQEVHSKVVADIALLQPKANKTEKNDKPESKSRRSKYVINYDDKNGTVSSICKIRPDHSATRKKKVVNYDNRDTFKNTSVNKNSQNKNNLLQVPDQHRIFYENYQMKSKFRARQSCQIL